MSRSSHLTFTRDAAEGARDGLDTVGTVTPGALADLVVLDADPPATIEDVRRIGLVVRAGDIYTRRELEW